MTLTELKALVSYWVDDVNFGYFTEVQVTRFLNQAQREVQKQLIQTGEQYYTLIIETSLVTDQTDYVLPSDFVKLHRLCMVLSGTPPNEVEIPIKPMSINQKDFFNAGDGTPLAYFVKQNRVVLYPPPDSSLNNKVLRMFYSYRVTDMSSGSDIPDVPADYHEYIAILAAMDCLIKDRRDVSSLELKKQGYLDLMKSAAEERNQDAPRTVIITEDDDYGYW